MRKEQIYLSTIASDAVRVAKEYGVNLEIAEYCTAWNMDAKFSAIDPVVRKKLTHSPRSLLHAPYNELFPCAIDKNWLPVDIAMPSLWRSDMAVRRLSSMAATSQ